MARISTYELDTTVQTTDKFLGSNADGTVKNFKMSDVSTYLRSTNSAGVGGQLAFVYHDSNNNGFGTRQPGTITFDAGGASVVALSGITTIKISKFPNGSNNSAVSLINTLLNTNIILSDTEDQDQFGVYQVTAIAQDSDETNFYDLVKIWLGSWMIGYFIYERALNYVCFDDAFSFYHQRIFSFLFSTNFFLLNHFFL